MNVLLFDPYSAGHHLEYASNLRRELGERDPALSVEFLTVAPTDEQSMYFEDDDLTHLYDRSPLTDRPAFVPDRDPYATGYDFLATSVRNPMWRIVGDFADYAAAGDYDVVHVLEVDKLLGELRCHLDRADLPPVVGSINGVFFKPGRGLVPLAGPIRTALEAGLTPGVTRYLPPFLRRDSDWDRWYLAACLDEGLFDHLTAPSAAAKRAVAGDADSSGNRTGVTDRSSAVGDRTSVIADRISVVPDPVESWDPDSLDGATARNRLDLPTDGTVLLFFGQMREEKGIRTLLRAVESYDGPPFTLVLAGPPSAISSSRVAATDRGSAVTIVDRLEYVPESDVFAYFRAADGVVLPYERSFGKLRPSTVFTKACAAGRPVVASDFGRFAGLVREHDLGLLGEPGSSESLRETLAAFVARDGPVHDPESMAAYAASQTYGRLAETVLGVYREVAVEESAESVE